MHVLAKCTGDRTFGKGKIQNVFELQDGSALFVTVARYQTPDYTDIDQKGLSTLHFCHLDGSCAGITPDIGCFPDKVGPAPRGEGRGIEGPSVLERKSLIDAELELDDCFLTAERFLNKQMARRT